MVNPNLPTDTHEEFGGYYKKYVKLHKIVIIYKYRDIGGSYSHEYGIWIRCWTCVRSTLMDLNQNNPIYMRHNFWSQCCVDDPASNARLLGNREVCEELDKENHYVGHVDNHPRPLSMLQWSVMKVVCSYCILEMRHMLNQFG